MHVHFNLLVYVICTPVSIKLLFFRRRHDVDTNGNNITAAGEAKIERRRGGGLFDLSSCSEKNGGEI